MRKMVTAGRVGQLTTAARASPDDSRAQLLLADAQSELQAIDRELAEIGGASGTAVPEIASPRAASDVNRSADQTDSSAQTTQNAVQADTNSSPAASHAPVRRRPTLNKTLGTKQLLQPEAAKNAVKIEAPRAEEVNMCGWLTKSKQKRWFILKVCTLCVSLFFCR